MVQVEVTQAVASRVICSLLQTHAWSNKSQSELKTALTMHFACAIAKW
jgi:hypothetical protein